MTCVAWAITGGGSFIRELARGFLELKRRLGVKITVFASKWGYEVARIYGVARLLDLISPGNYLEELFVGDNGFYHLGRFSMGVYRVLVVAPATSNTVAKIAYGIADTLPTAVFAQATKTGTPVIVLPTDIPMEDGYAVSHTPCYVDQRVCMYSYERDCLPARKCPVKAMVVANNVVRIDLSRCIGCMECVKQCRYNAIHCWREIRVKVRKIDLENIKKLKEIGNVHVVKSVETLFDLLEEFLAKKK